MASGKKQFAEMATQKSGASGHENAALGVVNIHEGDPVHISLIVTGHFANSVTGSSTRLRGV
jgi:hypothetical protein